MEKTSQNLSGSFRFRHATKTLFARSTHRALPIIGKFLKGSSFGNFASFISAIRIINETTRRSPTTITFLRLSHRAFPSFLLLFSSQSAVGFRTTTRQTYASLIRCQRMLNKKPVGSPYHGEKSFSQKTEEGLGLAGRGNGFQCAVEGSFRVDAGTGRLPPSESTAEEIRRCRLWK